MLAKHHYMAKLYRGSYRCDDTDLFLERLRESTDRLASVLGAPGRCLFVPVMLAEPLSVNETGRLVRRLEQRGVPVTDILVNRLYPLEDRCPTCRDHRRPPARGAAAPRAGVPRPRPLGSPGPGGGGARRAGARRVLGRPAAPRRLFGRCARGCRIARPRRRPRGTAGARGAAGPLRRQGRRGQDHPRERDGPPPGPRPTRRSAST